MKKIDGGREEWEVGPVRLITLLTAASQMQVTSPLYPLFASVTGVSLAATKKQQQQQQQQQQGWILAVEAYFTLFKVGMI